MGDPRFETCPVCHGSGIEERYNEETYSYDELNCEHCKGSGSVMEDKQESTCERCGDPSDKLISDGRKMLCHDCAMEADMYEGDMVEEIDSVTKCYGCSAPADEEHDAHCDRNDANELDVSGMLCPDCGGYGETNVSRGNYEICKRCQGDGHVDEENVEHIVPTIKYESFTFDKFMDATLLKETREATHSVNEVSPQRRLARNYQEHPLGRVRIGAKR